MGYAAARLEALCQVLLGCRVGFIQEVKGVDLASGATVPLGEISFRGYHIMRGYYGQPDKTAEAIDTAGWLRSGDLGTMDADG